MERSESIVDPSIGRFPKAPLRDGPFSVNGDFLRFFVESQGDLLGVATADLQQTLYISPGLIALAGISQESVQGNPLEWTNALSREDASAVKANVQGMLEERFLYSDQKIQFNPPQGSPQRMRLRMYRIPATSSEPAKLTWIVSSTLWTTEEIIRSRENEQRFEQMSQAIDDVLWIASTDLSEIHYVSPAYERIWGHSVAELMQNPNRWIESVVPEDRQRIIDGFTQFKAGKPPSPRNEFDVRNPDGRVFTVLVRTYVMRDDRGRPVGLCGTISDITGRRRVEDAVRERVARLDLAVTGANDGIWEWQLQTNDLYFSPRWKSMLGYEPHELRDQYDTWEKMIHPDDLVRARETVTDFLAGKIPRYELEHRLRHRDGSYRWILSKGAIQRDENGKPIRFAGAHTDVTSERELERELLEISERERRNIGHDLHDGLGQQLSAVELMSQVLVRQLSPDRAAAAETARGMGEQIRKAIQHIRRLSHGLSPVTLETHGWEDALRELARTTRESTHIRCNCEFPPNAKFHFPSEVATHLYRIAQEATNNAIRYAEPSHITYQMEDQGNHWRLSINDDGNGFSPAETSTPGLGLRVMQYRARLIGAVLQVESIRYVGTCIRCTFPKTTSVEGS